MLQEIIVRKYKLKELMEALILDKNSPLYSVPDGMIAGKDWRQAVLLKYVHAAEKLAKAEMMKEFPIVKSRIEEIGTFKIFKLKEHKKIQKEGSIF